MARGLPRKKGNGKAKGNKPAAKTAVDKVTEQIASLSTDAKESSTSQGGPAPEDPVTIRAERRAKKLAENKAKAAAAKERGNAHFAKGEYVLADRFYDAACELDGTNVAHFTNAAFANLKLGRYNEADMYAGAALRRDPRNFKARYRRALARLYSGRLYAAKADFEAMLKLDPDSGDAKMHIEEVKKKIEARGARKADTGDRNESKRVLDSDDSDFDEELFDEDDEDDEDVSLLDLPLVDDDASSCHTGSHTSDYEHQGNEIPCKAYNHDGCPRGRACDFSHAPDEQSVRDDL
ncbi:hypothetical protein FRB99_008710 [Tulasnella sp. 403]|nr:hypothetical protein FRB99_008710 [Tulasnella sp. 403]